MLINCSSEETAPIVPTGVSKTYTILRTNFSDLTGIIEFTENTNGSTTISVKANNTVKGINNPVRLRRNTANLGGDIAINLENINGETGASVSTISKLNNEETINYSELSEFDGYIAIEGENNSEGLLIAYADLGPNELTGRNTTINLISPDGVFNGIATLEERKKGNTSLTVGVFGINDNIELPCSIHIIQEDNSEFIKPISPVKGSLNGFGFNEITIINEIIINYDELLMLNGYIQVNNENDTSTFFARGLIN
ncbi:hypothetical protein [Maribacter sp. Asnod1-A12]|uniref:hypothetical protein n=1 Tax=Maribacter sp. Asnod1-A12 TaxID=3160576 RepID=UPI0038656656